MLNCVYVGLGGFIGAGLRYLIMLLMSAAAVKDFPAATFIINLTGGLAVGIFIAFNNYFDISSAWKLFFQIGVCGGFTTFSTFSLETLTMLENGKYGLMFVYVIASVALCLTFIWLGRQGANLLLK